MDFWGDVVPNWLAAVGTIGATAVAVWLAWREGQRAKRAEVERDQLRREAAARVASQVVVWAESDGRGYNDAGQVVEKWVLHVRNGSDQAVYGVAVSQEAALPGNPLIFLGSTASIPPQSTVQIGRGLETVTSERSVPRISITFLDPAGISWTRTPGGGLRRQLDEALRELYGVD
jgi:hypothetical protein